jgi:hypothetical protein
MSIDDSTRREFLKVPAGVALVAAGVGSLSGCVTGGRSPSRAGSIRPAARDLIRAENAKPGTTDWLLTNVRIDPPSRYRSPWIEGYCSRTSLRAGDRLDIMVSTDPASRFSIDIYRLGYYGGKGGRHLTRLGPFDGIKQREPDVGQERLRECRWEPSASVVIPGDWPSGVYLGKLTEEKEGLGSYVIFIVRDDRACDFLFQCSDSTWSAYNRWPSTYSLWDDGTTDDKGWYEGPNIRVSWDRPYGRYRQIFDAPLSQGSGEFLLWELPLAFWMEQQGYDVSYISTVDTHADGVGLARSRAFLSVGHDEFWSMDMFRNVQTAVAAGMNAAFLGGNSLDNVIALGPSHAGAPHRMFSRIGKFGPRQHHLTRFPGQWRQHGPDPAILMGARTTDPPNGAADWTCVNEKHWLFEGTGMKNGDFIAGLAGWEHHGEPAAIPGLEVLARGPVFKAGKPVGTTYTATIYPGPRDNLVFNSSAVWWSLGLSKPPGLLRPATHGADGPVPDARVARLTMNLFERFRKPG